LYVYDYDKNCCKVVPINTKDLLSARAW